MSGTFHLIGVGPGDPELLTLKAARVIAAADIVAYPDNGLALEIASVHVRSATGRLPIAIPMTTERKPAHSAYDTAAATIRAHLDAGRDVVYLCEGDPLFYGSAMYLLARIGRAEIVPGVTSLTAAAAAIARPLAARNEVLKVLPAPLGDDALRAELSGASAAAIIKVGRHFDRIRALLLDMDRAEGAIVVEHATTPRQRITPLRDFGHDERPYFSTILCYDGDEAWR